MKFKRRDVIQLTDEEVEYLNSLTMVQQFPDYLQSPTLGSKIKYEIRKETGGRCLMATEIIHKNEIICYGDSSAINKPIRYSYQIDENIHLVGPGGLDHTCADPTCIIDSKTNHFIAQRDIKANEFLTFNYLTTEDEINSPFKCLCKSENCFDLIKGYKFLSNDDKKYIFDHFGLSIYLLKRSKDIINS